MWKMAVFLSGKNSFYSGRMYIQWGRKGKGGGKGRGCSHQYVNAGVITTLPQRKTSRLCLSWENIPSPVIHVLMHLLSLKVILFLALRKWQLVTKLGLVWWPIGCVSRKLLVPLDLRPLFPHITAPFTLPHLFNSLPPLTSSKLNYITPK